MRTSSYTYDNNGNVKTDSYRGITNIEYNYLNLPVTITSPNVLNYTYDVTGRKLRKLNATTNTQTDYVNGIHYKNISGTYQIEFIQTEEGRALKNGSNTDGTANYSYQFTLADHLGNNRVTFYKNPASNNVELLESTDYYPFEWTTVGTAKENKYLYNNKELQEELGQYDYGARFYDPVIGRWNVIDKKAELYFQITPYAYAANTPTNAIDPDGHLVIFINGNHYGEGGSERYWRQYDRVLRFSSNFWNGSSISYRKEETYAFDKDVMDRLGDNHAKYVDGAGGAMKGYHPFTTLLSPGLSGVFAGVRRAAGYKEGTSQAAAIIESLHRTGGVIDESIKIITHSMGGAYAKGYVKAILDYARSNGIKGVKIAFEADFAPFQSGKQKAVKGVSTLQFSHDGDMVAGDEQMPGANKMNTGRDREQGHSIFGFKDQIRNLPTGNYKVVDGKIVPAD